MPFDGLFLHYLIKEVKDKIENKRIYKVININDTDCVFVLQNKINLLISVNPSHPHIRLTNKTYLHSNAILSTYMHKHIEGGIIKSINQLENDRLVIIDIVHGDELGYLKTYKLYLELMGKNSNLIITNDNNIILEALKKSYLSDPHLIKVGLKYIPLNDEKINPFKVNKNTDIDISNLQGLSKQAINEIQYSSLQDVLNQDIKPTIIKNEKTFFYHIDLKTIDGEREYFNNLSELLENFYDIIIKDNNINSDLKNTKIHLEKEIEKIKNKIEKQKIELEESKKTDIYERDANLLLANIKNIKPYQDKIEVFDYVNNEYHTIIINPKLTPVENVDGLFNKIKKMKRTQIILEKTIKESEQELTYYLNNLDYLVYAKTGDLKEIMVELSLKKSQGKTKPNICKYQDKDGNIYLVGKNNTQNNYITHTLANDSDYFFHIRGESGSHVILKGDLNDDTIKYASNLAAYYSKLGSSINVCVDYTKVKWIKKVKGEKGSFVTYTHEKTVYVNPDIKLIEELNIL